MIENASHWTSCTTTGLKPYTSTDDVIMAALNLLKAELRYQAGDPRFADQDVRRQRLTQVHNVITFGGIDDAGEGS